ncbi:MAG: SO_0444 family Cu/Zn efflux transporter [Candidatus Omnitrophica bacterium]|nr:SO_0444 family Cu/Zn efflux transporter [Candidatus Omnitrophota bacterium]
MNIVTTIIELAKEIWHTVDEAAIYILFGIFVAGLIQMFVDKAKIAKHLGGRGAKSVLLAAMCGIPLPLCSCGVLPTAISLRKNGASKGATLSFLISTPESGVDSIAISYALLDPIMTVFRPIAAFITAIVAGTFENIFGKKEQEVASSKASTCVSCGEADKQHSHSFMQKFKYGMRYAFVDLLGDISKWLMLGIIIAGIISYFVPQTLIQYYLGRGWQAMFLMLIVGIPLYICATASTPIAAALILKGMSPGVALVFLLVGPATNIAGILSVGRFLGRRSVIIYLLSISICAIGLGLLLNQIYSLSGINIRATIGKAGEVIPHYIKTLSSIILVVLMVNGIRLRQKEYEK